MHYWVTAWIAYSCTTTCHGVCTLQYHLICWNESFHVFTSYRNILKYIGLVPCSCSKMQPVGLLLILGCSDPFLEGHQVPAQEPGLGKEPTLSGCWPSWWPSWWPWGPAGHSPEAETWVRPPVVHHSKNEHQVLCVLWIWPWSKAGFLAVCTLVMETGFRDMDHCLSGG